MFKILAIFNAEESAFEGALLKSGKYDLYAFVDTIGVDTSWVKRLACYRVVGEVLKVSSRKEVEDRLTKMFGSVVVEYQD